MESSVFALFCELPNVFITAKHAMPRRKKVSQRLFLLLRIQNCLSNRRTRSNGIVIHKEISAEPVASHCRMW